MPNRWHPAPFASSSSTSGSAPSSRPSSRASSPTRNGPSSRPSQISLPRRSQTSLNPDDPLDDYFSGQFGTPGPDSAPGSASGPVWGGLVTPGASTPGMMTPGGVHSNTPHIEIILDTDHIVMRGAGGDMNPAYLSGRLELDLPQAINLKELTMHMTGKAKVQFSDGSGAASKSHHFSHPIIAHDWSFLQGGKGHAHTLKAGHHTFPFSFMLNGNLPSSLRTYSGDAIIIYKLRAMGVRSGFASNFSTQKEFTVTRMYTSDALEFTQTLEIENTWPGKVMYSLTLPFKAYAAGDDIPVNVKFMPLAKGIKVTTVVSVLKEYTLVHTRHSSRPDTRVLSCIKHEMRDGRAVEAAREPVRPPSHWVDRSAHSSRRTSPAQTPYASVSNRSQAGQAGSSSRPQDSYFPQVPAAGQAGPGPSSSLNAESVEDEEDVQIGDEEINTFFSIPVPAWATPSHSIHPVFITHKIKWSCSIANPDGHVSELRCALPILILDHSLLDEARQAGASTRGLLFGQSTDEPPVDLPSYSNHVYDRIAIADSGNATSFIPRSVNATPLPSPHGETPPHSRPPSRPASPNRGLSYGGQSTSSRSGEPTPATDVPPRRQLSSWADSELLLSLGALRTHSNETSPGATPPDSRAPSRPLSRRNSRSGRSSRTGSRANSRASSPERSSQPSSTSGSYADESHVRPGTERRGTGGFHGLFHLPKPIRPLSHIGHGKPILRNSGHQSGASTPHSPMESSIPRNASFAGLGSASNGHSNAPSERSHVSFAPHATTLNDGPSFQIGGGDGSDSGTPDATPGDVDPISRVPSYAIASRGFLGGGVVPLDQGLPTYDASERLMERTRSGTDLAGGNSGLIRPRSDTALVQLGAAAAAEAEERAAEEERMTEQTV
ncbi:hypothetical protein I317_07967 [Kwoniella heveanensis CBS 569]|nr:hypothetical protein I317_07967 [Kwoniella heveanensis CBS 569]